MKIELKRGTVNDLETIHPTYVDLFPVQERKTPDVLKTLLETEQYIVYTIVNSEDKTYMGFVLLLEQERLSAIWLDFIGIDKKYQGFGIGTKVMDALKQLYISTYNGMYLEVECLSEDPDTARRIRFYEQLGVKLLDVDYALPTLQGDFPMLLYYQTLKSSQMPSDFEIAEVVKEAHRFIHFDVVSA